MVQGDRKEVTRRSKGGRREVARHMLSASSSPWEEHNIKRLYKPYEAERAKATDDLKIEG